MTQYYPRSVQGSLLTDSNQVTDTPGPLVLGHLLAADLVTLADNTVARAVGIVVSAGSGQHRVVTLPGEVIEWPEHGLGPAGQGLWLGTAGGYLTAPPYSSPLFPVAARIQKVAEVQDADHLLFLPPHGAPPILQATYAFGAKFNPVGRFAVANGHASDNAVASSIETHQPIVNAGNLVGFALHRSSGTLETQFKLFVGGVEVAFIDVGVLGIFVDGLIIDPIPVLNNTYLEIQFSAGGSPNECLFEVTQVAP